MNQNKIEKFTDKLFLNTKSHKLVPKSLTSRSQQGQHNISARSSVIKPASINRQFFRQQKQKQGLSKTDIDKLQLMCADLNAKDYLNKLILIHQQQNAARCEEELQIVIPNTWDQSQLYKHMELKQQDSSNDLIIKNLDEKDQIKQYQSPRNQQNINKKFKKQKQDNQLCKNKLRKHNHIKRQSNYTSSADKKKQFVFVNKLPKSDTKVQKNSVKIQKERSDLKNNAEKTQSFNLPTYTSTMQSDDNSKKFNIQQKSVLAKNKGKQIYQNHKFLTPKQSIMDHKTIEDPSKIMKKQIQQGEFQRDQEGGVSNAKELQQICYVQIGKRMVSVTQKQIRRQFFKTNLHIRSYLMRNIVEYIKYLAQFSPDSIFVLPNERALHFEPNVKPEELNQYLEHTKYVQIIRNVNHIIQKNIFKQKYFEKEPDYWPFFMLGMFILLIVMLILVVFVGDGDIGLKNIFMVSTGLLICILLVVLIGYSLSCYRQETKFKPVCEVIYEDIDSYFKFINGKMENNIEWIIGQSFFWIQIKIRNQGNPINVVKNGKLGKTKNRHCLRLNLMQQSNLEV